MSLVIVSLITILMVYALWLFYLAVMNLLRVKKEGKLHRRALILGTPIILTGFVLDFIVNVTVMSVVLLEIPKEKTVTERLKRHNASSSGWRKIVASWVEPLLDPFDPSGDHI